MAAGIGARYGGLKQMDSVGPSGETIIDYSIYDAIRAGFESVVFVIREEMLDDFQSVVSDKYRNSINVEHVFQRVDDLPEGFSAPEERAKPWGTAHAMLAAREVIDVPFAVINADDMYGQVSFKIMADALEKAVGDHDNSYCMVGFELNKTLSDHGTVARGLCKIDERGYLSSVREILEIARDGENAVTPDGVMSGNEIVSMNLWGFMPTVFEHADRLFR
ncbi:nucleotidyltransferase, partial [bacterium B17]